MRRLLAFGGGLLSGAALGTLLALLFTPASGEAMRQGLRARYQHALAAGRAAAEQKRQELEAQLAQMSGVSLTQPAPRPNPPNPRTR